MSIETIHVYLLNEGTDTWVPVEAQKLGDDRYRVVGSMPEDQEWEFAPGDVVTTQLKTFADGSESLVAIARSG